MAPETTRRASRQRLWPFLHPFALRRRWLPSVCQAVPDIEPRRYLPFVGRRENALVGGTHAVLLLQPERRLAPRVRPPVRARVVIRVNQIMKWARMVRMTHTQPRRALQLSCVARTRGNLLEPHRESTIHKTKWFRLPDVGRRQPPLRRGSSGREKICFERRHPYRERARPRD
jgi:hypothetical protein